MNAMEWLSWNSPFLSPDVISKVITSFKDLFNSPDPAKREEFVKAMHGSNAVFTVLDTIRDILAEPWTKEAESRLAI